MQRLGVCVCVNIRVSVVLLNCTHFQLFPGDVVDFFDLVDEVGPFFGCTIYTLHEKAASIAPPPPPLKLSPKPFSSVKILIFPW